MSRLILTKQRRPSNRRWVPERDVLRAVLDLLAVERIWHRRMNTGAVKAEGRFFRFGSVGMADVLALPKLTAGGIRRLAGVPETTDTYLPESAIIMQLVCWIEVKSPGCQQSEAQRAFQLEVEAEGHGYLLVEDVDQLVAWLKERGL